jgi:fibronectin-binding autotransporter adhesin
LLWGIELSQLNGYIYFSDSHSYLLLAYVNLKLAPVKLLTVQGNEMQYTKWAVTIAATIAMLIGMQSFTECRGAENGTLSFVKLMMNANSPVCPPISGTYTGPVKLNSGVLMLRSALDTTRNEPLIIGTGTLTANVVQTGTVAGTGAIVNNNACSNLSSGGTLDLNIGYTSTSKPTIAIGAGALQINNTSLGPVQSGILSTSGLQINTASSGRWQVRNIGAIPVATLAIGGSGRVINSGTINLAGSAGLIKAGTGTITLSNNNSFTGATVVSGGTLQISNTGLGVAQVGTSTVTLNGNSTYTGASVINAGTLQLSHAGSGTLTLSGSGTISGSTAIQGGTLNISGLVSPSSGSVTAINTVSVNPINTVSILNDPTTLNLSSIASTTRAIGSGTLTIIPGAGTLQYGDLNSSGNLTIASGGTVQVNSINTSTLSIGAGSTLTIAAIPGGPIGSLTSLSTVQPIPEPSVMVLLSIAVLAFIRFGLGPKKSAVRP